jgi:hypothetical protein
MAAVTDGTVAPLIAVFVFAFVVALWCVLPRAEALKRLLDERQSSVVSPG